MKNHYRTHSHFRFASSDKQFDCFYLDQYRDIDQYADDKQVEVPDGQNDEDSDKELETCLDDMDDSEYLSIDPQIVEILEKVPYYDPIQIPSPEQIFSAQCLFCEQTLPADQLKQHMIKTHSFDFDFQLWGNLYHRIRQINYIRMHCQQQICPFCNSYSEDIAHHVIQHQKEKLCSVEDEMYYRPQIDGDQIFDLLNDDIALGNVDVHPADEPESAESEDKFSFRK